VTAEEVVLASQFPFQVRKAGGKCAGRQAPRAAGTLRRRRAQQGGPADSRVLTHTAVHSAPPRRSAPRPKEGTPAAFLGRGC